MRSIDLVSAGGPSRALGFYADPPEVAANPERSEMKVAQILSRACGHIGSGAEYLFRTVEALENLAIHDPYLWRLQELVAAEISGKNRTTGNLVSFHDHGS